MNGSSTHTGFASAPARCATPVSGQRQIDLRDRLRRLAALKQNHAKQMQAITLPGIEGENLIVEPFRVRQAAGLMQRHRLGEQCSRVERFGLRSHCCSGHTRKSGLRIAVDPSKQLRFRMPLSERPPFTERRCLILIAVS
ncbi:MAG: hypothetical protein WAL39_08720 [Xanthobacteraceae bacterium]